MSYSLKDVLAVDGGKDYIIHRYPESEKAFRDKRHKFKTRSEKTASASVYQKDGIWYMTDFGDDGKRMHAVDIAMKEDNLEFREALIAVATFYKLEGTNATGPRAGYDKWAAKPSEPEGHVHIDYKEFDIFELKILFSQYAWRAMGKDEEERRNVAIKKCTYLHFKAVKRYTYTSNGTTHEYSSNETFPIFTIEEEGWKKIYKPKDQKKYRFFAVGEKPKDFMHGFDQLQKFVSEMRGGTAIPEDGKRKKAVYDEDFMFDEIFICTGGSDALNVAALDYQVVWLNSETAELTATQYKELNRLANNIINLPDIDDTGKREAHELAMKYLEIKTLRLPESLKAHKDSRGNECKDVRDYLNHYTKYDFDQLMKTSLPYMFWEQEQKLNKDGEPVFKFGKPVWSYNFNNVRAYNFLYHNGFARFKSEKEKEGYHFIKIDGHVVRRVESSEIRDYVNKFLEDRFMPEGLRNIVYRSPQLAENSLANLPMVELDFQPFDADTQYFFFQTYNTYKKAYDGSVWKVTQNGIEEVKGAVGKYVWKDKVIERKIKILPSFFEAKKEDDWQLSIVDDSPMVFRFLIQTCRVHWRKELEERLGICSRLRTELERREYAEKYQLSDDEFSRIFNPKNTEGSEFVSEYLKKYKFSIFGELLTEAEKQEQIQHFLNRCYSVGYLLHRYKSPSRPWGVWLMDNKISDEGESHGGSGKSLLVRMLEHMKLVIVNLSGRNPRLTDNPHIFENVDTTTDLVNIDDCYDHFNFGFFYDSITTALPVNPKNKKSYSVSYSQSPKFIFSSNYGDRNTNPSDIRRKLYSAYSDYYHENTGDYRETRKPDLEFGRNLFTDWNDTDWEQFYNFMAQCVVFYLGCDEKLTPPMGNVTKRNLIAEMTEGFKAWADVYFTKDAGRVDEFYRKDIAFEDYKRESGLKNITAQAFKKRLQKYCDYMKYQLNPPNVGSFIQKITIMEGTEKRETSKEMIYIQTRKSDEKLVDLKPADYPF